MYPHRDWPALARLMAHTRAFTTLGAGMLMHLALLKKACSARMICLVLAHRVTETCLRNRDCVEQCIAANVHYSFGGEVNAFWGSVH